MELTRDSTLFLAVVIGLMIAFFTAFHADVAWDLMLLKADDTDDFTELKMLLTLDLMPFSTVEMTDLMLFQMEDATFLIAPNTVDTTFLILPRTEDTLLLMAFQTDMITLFTAFITEVITLRIAPSAEDTTDLIMFHADFIWSLQFSQISLKGRVMIWNAADRIEPISMTPVWTTALMVSQADVRKAVIPVQMLWNTDFTVVHT
jgi:hypothetical protein